MKWLDKPEESKERSSLLEGRKRRILWDLWHGYGHRHLKFETAPVVHGLRNETFGKARAKTILYFELFVLLLPPGPGAALCHRLVRKHPGDGSWGRHPIQGRIDP